MDDHLKKSTGYCQSTEPASRIMSERNEIISMVEIVFRPISKNVAGVKAALASASSDAKGDPPQIHQRKSITWNAREAKTFKILTRKHLASHNLDAAEYRESGASRIPRSVPQGLRAHGAAEDEDA